MKHYVGGHQPDLTSPSEPELTFGGGAGEKEYGHIDTWATVTRHSDDMQ